MSEREKARKRKGERDIYRTHKDLSKGGCDGPCVRQRQANSSSSGSKSPMCVSKEGKNWKVPWKLANVFQFDAEVEKRLGIFFLHWFIFLPKNKNWAIWQIVRLGNICLMEKCQFDSGSKADKNPIWLIRYWKIITFKKVFIISGSKTQRVL